MEAMHEERITLPWLRILLKPRSTFRYVVEHTPMKYATWIAVLFGILSLFTPSMADSRNIVVDILVALIIGSVTGLIIWLIGYKLNFHIGIHLSGLQRLLDNLYDQHTKDVLPPGQSWQLAEYLKAIHAPRVVEPTSLIPETVFKRLRNGVMCTHCDRVQMSYKWKTWTCPLCGRRDKHGHIRALKDYRLLYGETITNKQFSDFCGIESL